MKKIIYSFLFVLVTASIGIFLYQGDKDKNSRSEEYSNYEDEDELPKQTRIREALEYDFEITKDVELGYPPTERLFEAYKVIKQMENSPTRSSSSDINWSERGPYSVGGRTRTILIDAGDPSGETVFTAGVAGGLWKTNTISATPPNWQIVSDDFENMAICAVAQDPNNPDIMYFGTGEGFPNIDNVRGAGIWKSEDRGENWTRLSSTTGSDFWYIQRMLVHPNGNVFALTRDGGLKRSANGGNNWQTVYSAGVGGSDAFNDIELAPDGTIYLAGGYRNNTARVWRSPEGAPGTFTEITNGFSGAARSRIEIALAPTEPPILYAVAAIGGVASEFYVSTNGGNTWTSRSMPDIDPGGQSWYDLFVEVSPHDASKVITGAVRLAMSDNGGSSWVDVTRIHVDQHYGLWDPNDPDVCYIGNDGGIYRTTNATLPAASLQYQDLNERYNVTQFYACALSPELYSNDFLAGSQDNNTIKFDEPGLSNTRSVIGGDGMFCHIDQNEPNIWIGSSQFGNYSISYDGGQSFSGPPDFPNNPGGFINRSDYDDQANILYYESGNGVLSRWDLNSSSGAEVNLSNPTLFPTAITASPNVDNRVYIAGSGRVYYIDNAHNASTYQVEQLSNTLGGTVNCIFIEKGNEDHILVALSNYGSSQVRETRDGGETWLFSKGNLPDMPVRWIILDPTDATKAFIATETGVWSTELLDEQNTVWEPHTEFPNVRTDMLEYRESDNLIIAGTHGRGLWSTDALSPPKAFFEFPQAGYTDVDILFKDNSINSSTRLWNFGDGNTSTEREAFNSYESIGSYDVSLTINDGFETIDDQIKVLPDRSTPYNISSENYGGDFEGQLEDFGTYHISGTPLERGQSNIPGKSGTNSGSNAWVLGINEGQYESNTHTMLYTPNYDLSVEGIYEFRFYGKWAIQQGFDGFRVEYSLNRGQSWFQLGEQRENWYNYSNSSAGTNTAFQQGSDYFTGQTTGGWKQYRYPLNDLVGNPDVAFRFVFKADANGTATGIALDDVEVIGFTGELATRLIEFKGEFLSFEEIEIEWSTEIEYLNDGFELEVSNNGLSFETVQFVDGAGTTLDGQAYTVELDNQKKPIYYFRLKVINLDGSFFYSDIIVLKRDDTNTNVEFVFPNPVVDVLGIVFNDFITEPVKIEVFDAIGRLMYEEERSVGNVVTQLNLSRLSPGTYILRVTVGEEEYIEKISKN